MYFVNLISYNRGVGGVRIVGTVGDVNEKCDGTYFVSLSVIW